MPHSWYIINNNGVNEDIVDGIMRFLSFCCANREAEAREASCV